MDQVVTDLLLYGRLIGSGIMLIYIAYKVIEMQLSPNSKSGVGVLIRPVLIMAALALYIPLNQLLITQPFGYMNEAMRQVAQNHGAGFEQMLTDFVSTPFEPDDGGGSGGGNWFSRGWNLVKGAATFIGKAVTNPGSALRAIGDSITGTVMDVLSFIINAIVILAKFFMAFLQGVVSRLYYVMGVFALPLSLIPGNKQALSKWFFGYVAVQLWLPMIEILQVLIVQTHSDFGYAFDGPQALAAQIIILFMVFRVPKYANILVASGNEVGNTLMGSAAGAALTVATLGKAAIAKQGAKLAAAKTASYGK